MDAVSTPDLWKVLFWLDKIPYHSNILDLYIIGAKRTDDTETPHATDSDAQSITKRKEEAVTRSRRYQKQAEERRRRYCEKRDADANHTVAP